ncbi:group-specific protein [Lentibacillus saliphilus]|uniref:group-specific protein n=1 Tax=Lentibacillus saliphilus TaxID=2737028 RepID=UPI001C30915D|nr:group-specific protein [Lentibacillus saliphilus]
MIKVEIDEKVIEKLYVERIEDHIKELDKELIFWDSKELRRRTNLSWNTIQDTFFWHKDFPKVKLSGKWLFHAKKAEDFLNKWFEENRS